MKKFFQRHIEDTENFLIIFALSMVLQFVYSCHAKADELSLDETMTVACASSNPDRVADCRVLMIKCLDHIMTLPEGQKFTRVELATVMINPQKKLSLCDIK